MVALRRYLSPQREAMTGLLMDPPDWLSERSRYSLRETDDRLLRYVEELDAARERAIVIKDDIANQLSEAANRTLLARVRRGRYRPRRDRRAAACLARVRRGRYRASLVTPDGQLDQVEFHLSRDDRRKCADC